MRTSMVAPQRWSAHNLYLLISSRMTGAGEPTRDGGSWGPCTHGETMLLLLRMGARKKRTCNNGGDSQQVRLEALAAAAAAATDGSTSKPRATCRESARFIILTLKHVGEKQITR